MEIKREGHISEIVVKSIFIPLLIVFFSISFFTSNQFHEIFFQIEDYFFLVSGSIIVFYFLLISIFNKTSFLDITRLDIFLMLTLMYILLRLVNTKYQPVINLFSIKLAYCFILYILFKHLIKKYEYIEPLFVKVIVFISFIQATIGILQHFNIIINNNSFFKIGGTFGNPGIYANFLVSGFTLAFNDTIINLRKNSFKKSDVINSLSICSILIVIPFTQSRIAWIVLLISSITIIEFHLGIIKKKVASSTLKKVAVLFTISFLFAFSLIVLFRYKEQSSKGRLFIWKISTLMIKDNFWVGIGVNRFEHDYNFYQAKYFETQNRKNVINDITAGNTTVAFNEYIQILVEYGFLGFILFFSSIMYFFYSQRKIYQADNIGYILVITSFLIQALTFYPFHVLPIVVIIIFLVSTLDSKSQPFKKVSFFNKLNKIIVVVCFIFSTYMIKIIADEYLDLKKWEKADELFVIKSSDNSMALYQKSYENLSHNSSFLYDYGCKYYLRGDYDSAIYFFHLASDYFSSSYLHTYIGVCYSKTKKYPQAEKEFQLASMISQNEFLPLYYLYITYKDQNKYTQMQILRQKINRMKVKVHSEVIDKIKVTINSDSI